MVPRFIVLTMVAFLIYGVAVVAPSRGPVRAQDANGDWPEIPTFQVPGTFQVAGTVDDAGDIAEVPGSIQVVTGGEGRRRWRRMSGWISSSTTQGACSKTSVISGGSTSPGTC